MNDLKPCPFCGSEAEVICFDDVEDDDPAYKGVKVKCKNWQCECGTMIEPSKKIAMRIWNRRVNDGTAYKP